MGRGEAAILTTATDDLGWWENNILDMLLLAKTMMWLVDVDCSVLIPDNLDVF